MANIHWINLPGKWFQKVYLASNSGELPIYTYHYGNKLQSATKVLVLETERALKLCSYKLIEKDLRDILIMLDKCDEIQKKHDLLFRPNDMPKDGIILKGLISAIIVHYFRCFPGGKGRKYKLQKQKISKEYIATHEILNDMRDTYIAHDDVSIFEGSKLVFLVPPYKKIKRGKLGIAILNTEMYQAIGGGDLIEMIRKLVDSLRQNIVSEINTLCDEIKQQIDEIPKERLYKFMDNAHDKRVILNEKQLKMLLTS